MPHISMVSLDFYGLVVPDLTHRPAQLYNLHYLQKKGCSGGCVDTLTIHYPFERGFPLY